MSHPIKYPIGQQNFKVLREMGSIYIDKTSFIEKIVRSGGQFFFLARPRRFGKSLFLSTLQYFFEGERRLFTGLYADSMEWDWTPYPVLRLDLNTEKYAGPGLLDDVLDRAFRNWEEKYGIERKDSNYGQRFGTILKSIHENTGRQVVILVDEYDKPLVGNLNKDDNFEHYRNCLANLYSNFKSSAEHIRLVFLTGVSRFSKLSIFSDLNNLNDISFDNEYADICGITAKELLCNLQSGIQTLAEDLGMSYEETVAELKDNYDGYRFARKGSDIYNPWSVLNCLDKQEIDTYWVNTGVPTLLAEVLKNTDADLQDTMNTKCDISTLSGFDLRSANPLALLYQTGYLTIKDYDRGTGLYTLGVPNKEVSAGLFNVLIPYYLNLHPATADTTVRNILNSILEGRPDDIMKNLKTYFSGIPYDLKIENENNFQNAFYVLSSLIGAKTHAEVHTSEGRIDLVIETSKYVYIIELKYDSTSKKALDQIEEKHYARPFEADPRRIFKIGANFSSKTRTIEDWIVL